MGGCLSSKLLVTTTSRSLSFRNHPFHHYTSNSATTNSDHDDDDPSSASTAPPPAPSHHPVPNNNNSHLLSLFRVANRLQRPDAATSLGAAAADTIIDFMGKGLYLDDHPPPHDQTSTSTTTDDHAHTNASHQRLIGVISCGRSSPDHHQINDSAGTTSKELFLHKQLADRQVQFNPESNGMVVPVRSRSFHTVEEYDTIVRLEYLSQSHNSQTLPQVPDHHQLLPSSKPWSNISREADDDDYDQPTNTGAEYSSITNIRDCSNNKQVKVRSAEESNSCKDAVLGEREEDEEEEEEAGRSIFHLGREERGSKRKMMAKGLVGSLQVPVPPPLEFTTTVSLRQWLLGGGGGGGSDYVTPKFGSYNHIHVGGGDSAASFGEPMGKEEDVNDAGGGKIIIDPELVAAFEECMQQLEMEEEKLIKQIEDEDEDDHQF